MTQEAINQSKVLLHLTGERSVIESLDQIYHQTPVLKKVLESRVVSQRQKERIIDDIALKAALPDKIKNYIKLMCRYGQIDELEDAIASYYHLWDIAHNILRTSLIFSQKPEEDEVERVRAFLKTQYPDKEIEIQIKINPELLGGVLIQVGHEEYDWSYEGCFRQLESRLI